MNNDGNQKGTARIYLIWFAICCTIALFGRESAEPENRLHHDEARQRAVELLSARPDLYQQRLALITSARVDSDDEEGWIVLFNIPGSHDLDDALVVELDRNATEILSLRRATEGRDDG